jgi:hypothetical protein
MAKQKLSEMVAALEDDFQYQYNYNETLIEHINVNNQHLNWLGGLYAAEYKRTATWFYSWLITFLLLVATWIWMIGCPLHSSQLEEIKQEIVYVYER